MSEDIKEELECLYRRFELVLHKLDRIERRYKEGIKDIIWQFHDTVYTIAQALDCRAVIEFDEQVGKDMANKAPVVKDIQYVIPTTFHCALREGSLGKMVAMMEDLALSGDRGALSFCLNKVYTDNKRLTYTKGFGIKGLKSQKDIDMAMDGVLYKATHPEDSERISLEEADMLASLLIKKKESMDECILERVIEVEKQLGIEA